MSDASRSLVELVSALERTNWSSWQTTAEFSPALQEAKKTVATDRARDAGPELLEMLRRLEVSANTVAYCYDKRPENFASALQQLQDDAEEARAVIAKVAPP